MTTGRALLVALGLLIAGFALFLVVQGFGGLDSAPVTSDTRTVAEGTDSPESGPSDDSAPARWQSFIRPGATEPPPPRPIRRTGLALTSPFDRPVVTAQRSSTRLRLEGISSTTPAMALISGQIVRVGETVAGFRVQRIDRVGVSLANAAGRQLDLTLGAATRAEASASPSAAAPGGAGPRTGSEVASSGRRISE